MRIEMDQGNLAVAVDVGDCSCVGERDGVIAAEDDRYGSLLDDAGDAVANLRDACLHVPGSEFHVADIDDG